MPRRRRDDDFDHRLEMEIIVDAKPEEQSIGWDYYLEEHLRFRFHARRIAERPTSPLRVGDVVDVRAMAADEVCEHEMFANIAWQERLLAVPLVQLAGVAINEGTEQEQRGWDPSAEVRTQSTIDAGNRSLRTADSIRSDNWLLLLGRYATWVPATFPVSS